jgi:hypothetical protein
VLQQRKLHVLEKEMRLTKQQLVKLVQDVEDDVPLPQKAEQKDVLQLDDELAVQKDVPAEQNVDVQLDVPAEQNVDVQLDELVEQRNVHQLNVEDDDKTLNLFSIFF